MGLVIQIELAEYCRAKGLFVEQVAAWSDACIQANGGVAVQAGKLQKELRVKEQVNKALSVVFFCVPRLPNEVTAPPDYYPSGCADVVRRKEV